MNDFFNYDFSGNELNDDNSIRIPKDLLDVIFNYGYEKALMIIVYERYLHKWEGETDVKYICWSDRKWDKAVNQTRNILNQLNPNNKIYEFLGNDDE